MQRFELTWGDWTSRAALQRQAGVRVQILKDLWVYAVQTAHQLGIHSVQAFQTKLIDLVKHCLIQTAAQRTMLQHISS